MGRSCYVPGCKTGYNKSQRLLKSKGSKMPSLFQPPKIPGVLEKWQEAISRVDRLLSAKDFVCELHFLPCYVEKHFETKMPDGSIHRIERKSAKLNPRDAIPTIFPNTPSCISKYSANRKSSKKRICSDTKPFGKNLQKEGLLEKDFQSSLHKVHDIIKNILQIKLPSDSWSYTILKKKIIIFMQWSQNYTLMKQIIIDENLQIKVYINSIPVTIFGITKCQNLEAVLTILNIVENVAPCPGFGSDLKRSKLCKGYIPSNSHVKGCVNCTRYRDLGVVFQRI